MKRRGFLRLSIGGVIVGATACTGELVPDTRRRGAPPEDAGGDPPDPGTDGGPGGTDAGARADSGGADAQAPFDAGAPGTDAGAGECTTFVTMYDTYAQALYFDGTYGPLTGVIYVDYVVTGTAVEIEFWHGHGGVSHRYTVGPEDFQRLKRGERVTLETTEVDGHTHTLFIDPMDPSYRVPGAAPVQVPDC